MNDIRKAMLSLGLAGMISGAGVMYHQFDKNNKLRTDERVEEVLDLRNIAYQARRNGPSPSVNTVYDFVARRVGELEQVPEVNRKLEEYETNHFNAACGLLLALAGFFPTVISLGVGIGYQRK